MSPETAPPDRHWILHTPYREPDRHWELDNRGRALDRTVKGRRPSSTQLPVPKSKVDTLELFKESSDSIEPHGTINEIRKHVQAWRDEKWPGVHTRVLRLLEHWASEGALMRPFWCQREAVETLIWLFDAGRSHAPEDHSEILARLERTNKDWNHSIPRVAVKMATGTGKTLLMAMIALWWTVRKPEGLVEFLALAPGLTIREGLRVLADKGSSVWKAAAPLGFERDLGRMRWTVLNFQAFRQKTTLAVGGKNATKKEKALLVGKSAQEPASWTESSSQMLDRLLKEHRGGGPITVINDEAHHCYTSRQIKLTKRREDTDEREDRERAELWFGALQALSARGRLEQVFDLSATPMWLRRPARLEAETFPWTVSDFSLLDAVESGLVKVPRVPVDERLVDHGQPVHTHPRFRNVYLHNDRRSIGATLTPKVREPLDLLYEDYCSTVKSYAAKGRLPVIIVVANDINNATALHRYIAGYRQGDVWKPGNLPILSNSDPVTGQPRTPPPTLLVHSRMDDLGAKAAMNKVAKAIEEQATLFAPDAQTRKEKRQAIRDALFSVGKRNQPGEHIQCVISVGMLTEGWDARTVTHVFGYRAFRSQLLCEQVAGRALRKSAFSGTDEIQSIEYANLFGVPFGWLGGVGGGDPPLLEYETVYTVPDRRRFRIFFPHVSGYGATAGAPRWRVRAKKLAEHQVRPRKKVITDVEGPTGSDVEFESDSETDQRALWLAAAQLVHYLDGGRDHRRQAFLCSISIVRECLSVMKCERWSDLQHDEETLALIASRVRRTDQPWVVAPIFADQACRSTPRISDTSNIRFRTTLKHWYPQSRSELPARSELSGAACHSQPEALLAELLDEHPHVSAWVRNFQLGWTIPYFDPVRGAMALTEPDFVAESNVPTKSGRKRRLVIEFKGMKAGEPSELSKQKYLEEYWAPAVSVRTSDPTDLGDWQAVWIEHIDQAQELITEACHRKEWA